MKKRIKITSILLTVLLAISAFVNHVKAAGTVTATYTGNSAVTVGSNIVLTLRVENVTSGDNKMYSIGGFIDFDPDYLEYVDSASTSSLIKSMNTTTYKIALADYTMSNGVGSNSNVATITFKAKKIGTTSVGLKTPSATDANSNLTVNFTSKTITINELVTEAPKKSNDATLKSLGVTGQTLSPKFSASTTSYTVEVPESTTSVTITGAVNNSKATVTGLGKVDLTGESTTANVKVTAEDGTVKTYKITIKKKQETTTPVDPTPVEPTPTEKSSDATLKNLSVSGYGMSPTFNPETTQYVVKVPKDATFVKINGTVNDSKATVNGLGDIDLTGDSTTAEIKVTAEDGTEKIYTIVFEKEEETPIPTKSSDATLKSLDVSGYTLNPTFKSDVTSYSMTVQNTVTGLDVIAIPNSEAAKVEIVGNNSFQVGVNTITIKVIAEDGTTKFYTVNVTRKGTSNSSNTTKRKSSDNSIDSFVIKSPHTISPAYSDSIDSYSVTVPYDVEKLDMEIILNDAKATYTIMDNNDFKVGEVNPVTIKVVAEDGTTRIITLNVNRSTQKDGTDLKNLLVDSGNLDPNFSPSILDYVVNVPSDKSSLGITAIPVSEDSKVEIFGNENLKDGFNRIKILVTDKNGYTKTYTISAYKEPTKRIFGLLPWQFGILSAIIGTLLLLLLFLLFKRKKKEESPVQPVQPVQPQGPVIDFKPEFNFGSRNGTDDDIVYPNAVLNQSGGNQGVNTDKALEQPTYIEREQAKEIPYDMYDEVVTKDELIDAIHEGLETKNPEKLKMLLEQEELNRRKEEMRRREERR